MHACEHVCPSMCAEELVRQASLRMLSFIISMRGFSTPRAFCLLGEPFLVLR